MRVICGQKDSNLNGRGDQLPTESTEGRDHDDGNAAYINHLPPETLAAIFLHYRDIEGDLGTAPYSWTKIVRVCRQWRDVAYDTVTLWSQVNLQGVEWRDVQAINALMARSGDSTQWSISGFLHEDVWPKTLGSVAHRICSADLHLYIDQRRNPAHEGCQPQPWSSLKSLKVTPCFAYSGVRLPVIFAKGSYPVLQELKLTGYSLEPSSKLWVPTLTTVQVVGNHGNSISDVMRILTNLPALQYLVLERISYDLPRDSFASSPVSSPVPLANLKSLTLTGEAFPCIHLIYSIAFPANASVSISINRVAVLSQELFFSVARWLVPTLGTRNRTGTIPVYRVLALASNSDRFICAMWESAPPGGSLKQWADVSPRPGFRLSIATNCSGALCGFGNFPTRQFFELLSSYPVEHVQSVALIQVHSPLMKRFRTHWESLFSVTARATQLHIVGKDMQRLHGLAHLLLGHPESKARDQTASPPNQVLSTRYDHRVCTLPRLERLVLEGIPFRHSPAGADENSNSFLKKLLCTLKERRRVCSPIDQLVIRHCFNLQWDDIKMLADEGTNADWDQIVECRLSKASERSRMSDVSDRKRVAGSVHDLLYSEDSGDDVENNRQVDEPNSGG